MASKISSTGDNLFDVLRNDRITINVGGYRHNTFLTTLKNVPDTRLSWIAENHPNSPDYDPVLGEYFFDRHPRIFTEVLNYYRIGKLHCPVDVCSALFQEELSYWGINDRDIEPCCWVLYKRQMNTEETLKTFHLDNARKSSGDCDSAKAEGKRTIASLFGSETIMKTDVRERWKRFRPKVWALLDDPRSSLAAKVRKFFSCFSRLLKRQENIVDISFFIHNLQNRKFASSIMNLLSLELKINIREFSITN